MVITIKPIMEQDQNAILHLESDRQLQGSIRVVGPLLTPEEERQLESLMTAETNATDAIDQLAASDVSKS